MTLKNDERNVMSQLYMKKAYKALQTAKEIKENDPDTAIARAYYSMFYAAQSALVDKGITGLHRHEGVNSNFGEQFVKTALFPKEIFRTMGQAEKNRYEADYNPQSGFLPENAQKHIDNAEKFVDTIEKMLAKEHKKAISTTNDTSRCSADILSLIILCNAHYLGDILV